MLVLEVQLPQQEGRKKIEWNKNGDPTFEELKKRLQQCGVPDDWCIEVLRGSKFFSPVLQTHIHGPKITLRAAPLLGALRTEEEHPGDVQWTRWMKAAFEKVVSHVGRVYLVDTTKEEEVILVSRSGRVKGIHVEAFTCGELREKMNSENQEELRIAKKLCNRMSSYASSDSIAMFVPPHGLVKLLELEGGCELLQAAIRQNKEKMKLSETKQPKPPSRPGRSNRSMCPSPYSKSRTSSKRRRAVDGKPYRH